MCISKASYQAKYVHSTWNVNVYIYIYVCVCVCVCVRASVRACVRVCSFLSFEWMIKP